MVQHPSRATTRGSLVNISDHTYGAIRVLDPDGREVHSTMLELQRLSS